MKKDKRYRIACGKIPTLVLAFTISAMLTKLVIQQAGNHTLVNKVQDLL